MLYRKLFLSLMFLRSQSLTVWSTDAVANSQSQHGLNSTWVTLALWSFWFHSYKKQCNKQWVKSICAPWVKTGSDWSTAPGRQQCCIAIPITSWPSISRSKIRPVLSPVATTRRPWDTSTLQYQQLWRTPDRKPLINNMETKVHKISGCVLIGSLWTTQRISYFSV